MSSVIKCLNIIEVTRREHYLNLNSYKFIIVNIITYNFEFID